MSATTHTSSNRFAAWKELALPAVLWLLLAVSLSYVAALISGQ